MELEHGCRATYGPLELRIQTTASLNGFSVFIEDPRRKPSSVYKQTVQATLDSVKDYLALRAREYLDSWQEEAPADAQWRCS